MSQTPHPLNHDLVDEMGETEFERQRRLAGKNVSAPGGDIRSTVNPGSGCTQVVGQCGVSDLCDE